MRDGAEVGPALQAQQRVVALLPEHDPPDKGKKRPYSIRIQDGGPFAFAALWERWNRGDSPIDSCTILTTDANELVGSIHDRMPVILNAADYDLWLDPDMQDARRLEPLLVPYTGEPMAAYLVSMRVNSPANNDARCIEPVG